jgi:hypothetical protein
LGPDKEGESSNFWEFENVVSSLEEEARQRNLEGALVYLFTNNSTVESVFVQRDLIQSCVVCTLGLPPNFGDGPSHDHKAFSHVR